VGDREGGVTVGVADTRVGEGGGVEVKVGVEVNRGGLVAVGRKASVEVAWEATD
jgi:hypothetical protein